MIDIKRDTIAASTIITVLFMLKRKKASAAEAGKAQELRTGATAVALDGGEVISPGGVPTELQEMDFSQKRAIFIRYPGYAVFVAPTTGTIQKEDETITLTHH